MTYPRPHRSNCVIFALAHWWRSGGYLVIRRSYYGYWPHVLWTSDLVTFEEFTPLLKKRRRWFPPLLFRGVIQREKPPRIS